MKKRKLILFSAMLLGLLLMLIAPDSYAQSTVSGTVRDSTGSVLRGVSVLLKGKNAIGTSTDLNGKYILDVPKDAVLEISLMGYQKLEIPVNGRSVIDISLIDASSNMDEVVVVGFGTQKKLTTVGSQSTIKPEELKLPVRNLNTALTGRLSGLVGVQRSGEPGNDNAEIFIRGIATIDRGLSQPLILVDGVERPMNDIDPEDIESFTMLKDASATAVYGVRGANGVIIITTKRGKQGKAQIKLRYTEGVTTFTKLPELAGGVEYMNMANEASTSRGGTLNYTQDRIDKTASREDPLLFPDVDWYNTIFNEWSGNRNANVNISGGSQFVTYYLSTGYFNELGILKNDALSKYNSKLSLDRYNFTSNLSINATKSTKIDLGIQGNMTNRNLPGAQSATQIFDYVMSIPPVFHAVTYPDRLAGSTSSVVINPYNALTQRGYRTEWTNRIFSNLRVTQDLNFLQGLSATAMFSFDGYNSHNNSRTKEPDRWLATERDAEGNLVYNKTYTGSQYLGFASASAGNRQFYVESSLNYNRTFSDHTVGGLLLFNQRDFVSTGGDLISSLPYRSRGLAGRANYSYKNKYLTELNFGYNGSENFNEGDRYGFFPSVGLGWVVSEEAFFSPVKDVLQFLKFRFTHGSVGNSTIGGRRFAFIGTVANTTGYSFGRGQANNTYTGIDLDEYPVDVTWETSVKTNYGLEAYMLNNKLNIQLDFFKENREGIFLRRTSLPNFLGIRKEPYGNLGVVLNKGVDASMTYKSSIGKVFLDFQGNFTYARNKIVKNDDPARKYTWMDAVGRKTTQAFGYVAEGLFADSTEIQNSAKQVGDVRPGDIKFKDLNGDGLIDQFDKQAIGYGAYPEIIYGFGLTGSYKGLTIGAFFQGAGNVDIVLNGEGLVPFGEGSERGNLFANINDRWTPENQNLNAFYPRLSYGILNDNYATSTWFMRDASYLRLKTLQMAYELPGQWMKGIGVKTARVSLIGYNVLTFSKFKLWDVELGSGRGTNYPNMTTYSIGVDLNF